MKTRFVHDRRGSRPVGRCRRRSGLGIFLFFACAILLLCLIVGLASSTQTGSVTRTEGRLYGNAVAASLARAALDEAFFRFRFLASPGPGAAAGSPGYTGGPAFDWYGFFTKATEAVSIAPVETVRAAAIQFPGAEVDPIEVRIENQRRRQTYDADMGPQYTVEMIDGILQFTSGVRLKTAPAPVERRIRLSRPFRIYLSASDYAAVTGAAGSGGTTDKRVILRRALRIQRPVAEVVVRP